MRVSAAIMTRNSIVRLTRRLPFEFDRQRFISMVDVWSWPGPAPRQSARSVVPEDDMFSQVFANPEAETTLTQGLVQMVSEIDA